MRIITDVMGGDNPASEMVKGAVEAKRELGIDMTLVGDENEILNALSTLGCSKNEFEIVPTNDVITMEDEPMSSVRAHKDSSMSTALKLLASGGGDACVSCGNTGALFTGATLFVKRAKGVRRAALAMLLPYSSPVLMLDCGANVTVEPEYLVQFAYLGSIYMEKVVGVANPRVGLVNNGVESHKGTPGVIQAYNSLKKAENLNFIGNVEGKDIPYNACDVIVCDGFTGNIILKTSEGLCRFVTEKVKAELNNSISGKISLTVSKKQFNSISKFFDSAEYGGAPFLGISKPVIKAHGNSDATAFKNAIKQAYIYAQNGVIGELEARADELASVMKES